MSFEYTGRESPAIKHMVKSPHSPLRIYNTRVNITCTPEVPSAVNADWTTRAIEKRSYASSGRYTVGLQASREPRSTHIWTDRVTTSTISIENAVPPDTRPGRHVTNDRDRKALPALASVSLAAAADRGCTTLAVSPALLIKIIVEHLICHD
jgi:hypothetical protein